MTRFLTALTAIGWLMAAGTSALAQQNELDWNGRWAKTGTPGGCQVFLTKSSFDDFNLSTGKILKGIETFEEANVEPKLKLPLPAPLEGNVPNVDPAGFGFPTGLTEKNLVIQDNVTPGPTPPAPNPSGNPQALYVIGPGFIGANSKKVGEDLEVLFQIEASLDLIFLDDNKTGIGFELSHFDGFEGGPWIVSVYDLFDNVIGVFTVPDAIEPAKQFFGVWCDTPIGRINIWDEAITPDAVDNIQMYFDQEPACPWDCGDQNKVVDTVDFLALLAQWGLVGTPCDFGLGNPGVDTPDFLKLLANWGPCPAPGNDECVDAVQIDRFDDSGTTTEHFDMYGATPSPQDPKCSTPLVKDIWYCLRNGADVPKGVTIFCTVDLEIEVNQGCACDPPGPLVACGFGLNGTPQFEMQPGEQVLIRLRNVLGLPNELLKGELIIENKPVPPDDLNVFFDEAQFVEHLLDKGKVTKLDWDFNPTSQPPGQVSILDSPLDINTHGLNVPDPWTDAAGKDLWPPEVDNIQFVANANPQGPFENVGVEGLAFLTPPFNGVNNNVLSINNPGTSFGIISGPPAGDNHTAFGLELVDPLPDGVTATFRITVYDKNDQVIGTVTVTVPDLEKVFLGLQAKQTTIGRIDIFETSQLAAAISRVTAWRFETGTVNFFTDPAVFFDELGQQGKTEKFFWNFKPDLLPNKVSVGITAPLDISTHTANAPGIWSDDSGIDLWPPQVDNVQFWPNLNPGGPLVPGQIMGYVKGGPVFPLDNNALVGIGPDSLTIISGPPAGDNHTAFQLELVHLGPQDVADLLVTVFDKEKNVLGQAVVTLEIFQKAFLGIVTKDPLLTIGAIDIWAPTAIDEGISAIAAYRQPDQPVCPGDGDCCVMNGTPGCDNPECCEAVCAVDPFCCDIEWDQACVNEAVAIAECGCSP